MSIAERIARAVAALAATLVILSAPAHAGKYLDVAAVARPDRAAPGGGGTLVVTLRIHPPYHVNANPASFEHLIPTMIALDPADDLTFGKTQYPRGVRLKAGGSEEAVAVYQDAVEIKTPFRIRAGAAAARVAIRGSLQYQPCDDQACFKPERESFEADIDISNKNMTPSAASTESGGITTPETPRTETIAVPAADTRAAPSSAPPAEAARGFLASLLFAFLGGLGLNLTPCVYPLIPITIGYFSRQSATRGRRLLLAALFVISMAIVFAALGTVAALTGSLFGAVLQNPVVLVLLALLMVALALGMFGAWEFRLPGALAALADARPGAGGAIFMGATMGLACAPCIGPFIVGLLAIVGRSGDPRFGFALFFMLGLGLGAPYFLLAFLSGEAMKLPRGGTFLETAKKLLGLVLLGLALWFLRPLIGAAAFRSGIGLLVVAAGLGLIFGPRPASPGLFWLRRGVGIACVVGSIVFFRPEPPLEHIAWRPYSPALVAEATANGRPVMIDVSAAWCIPCQELDAITFSDSTVREAARPFLALKADVTGPKIAPEVDALTKKYTIVGVPTVLFFDATGRERDDLRLTGFEGPDEFTKRLESAAR